MPRTVTLLYFAWIRERVGKGSEELVLPDTVQTVAALIDWLRERDESYVLAFRDSGKVRVAIDQEHVDPAALLGDAREIAFFPPVTGG